MPSDMTASPDQVRVVVIGGGLAGIAAATALAEAGCSVDLYESRAALGGRATSYVDASTGETIDNCQHVAMGCCTNFLHLARLLHVEQEFETVKQLNFVSSAGRVTRFAESKLPAPAHLLTSFAQLPWLSWREKYQFSQGVRALARVRARNLRGLPFLAWLREYGQSENLIRNLWELVLVSALSESLDRIDAAAARKVFVDGFLANREGWRVLIPRVPLGELFGTRGLAELQRRNVRVHLRSIGPQFTLNEHGQAVFPDRPTTLAEIVLALPWHQLSDAIPHDDRLQPLRLQARRIEHAPITSVHLWFNQPITNLPHAVFVGRLSQWLFARQQAAGEGARYQVVISNSGALRSERSEQIIAQVVEDLRQSFPSAITATLQHARVVTERRAVFSVTPGIDDLRPAQQTAIENLQVAGDWTRTGWPSTMESAVKSGFLAADNILQRHGLPQRFTQPELPITRASRWLLGVQREESI